MANWSPRFEGIWKVLDCVSLYLKLKKAIFPNSAGHYRYIRTSSPIVWIEFVRLMFAGETFEKRPELDQNFWVAETNFGQKLLKKRKLKSARKIIKTQSQTGLNEAARRTGQND